MHSVQVFYHPDDIHQHFYGKWHTDLFRHEHNKGGSYLHGVMERVAKYPLFTYSLSHHPSADIPIHCKTEWRHLSVWWGGIHDFVLDNPLNDACWLHEFGHRIWMSYTPGLSLPLMKQKMAHNELRATLVSMFEVYFHYPEFRDLTYPETILADRFLDNKQFMQAWKYDSFAKSEQLFLMLCEATLYPNPADPLEHFFYEYNAKTEKWTDIWSKRHNLIESRMHKLQQDIQCGADRRMAMDDFMAWLQSDDITQGTEIPFFDEAMAYADIYQNQ